MPSSIHTIHATDASILIRNINSTFPLTCQFITINTISIITTQSIRQFNSYFSYTHLPARLATICGIAYLSARLATEGR